ncbi:uncharacterized protein LOC110464897, partial [Mizuhopecten yessoensis]|uniref:uncharacterized protein LOC110464897 n=1 Tax=Mizuhopecten yessoensis TaxID=6573 RepID=UPI000B45C4B7
MYLQQHWWLRFHCCFVCLAGCYAIDPGCNGFPEARVDDRRYDGDLLESLSPVGYQQCRKRCRARHVCLGINYNRELLLCELVRITTSVSAPLTVVPGYSFTDLNVTDVIPAQEICRKDSCPEQHMCIILKSTGNLTCVDDYNAVSTTTTTMLPTTITTTPTTTTT